ncbi:MAG: hypothetical protein FWD15_02600 [Alphaproteobacteria bacterium]|nr:hypothetical protein [Alphaproteobacteria bacterium]
MIYIILAFVATFVFCIAQVIESNLAVKRFRRPATLIFYLSVVKILVCGAFVLTGQITVVPVEVLVVCILWGAGDVIHLFPVYKSYKLTDTSIVGALSALGKVPIPLFAFLFLGEVLATWQYIGFFIIVLGSMALSIEKFRAPRLNEVFFLMLIAATISSMAPIAIKYALAIDGNFLNLVVYANVFSALFAFSFFANPAMRADIKEHFAVFKKSRGVIIASEILCSIGHVLNFYVLGYITVLASIGISSMAPFFVMSIGLFLGVIRKGNFNERADKASVIKKSICFLVITFGIILTIGG